MNKTAFFNDDLIMYALFSSILLNPYISTN